MIFEAMDGQCDAFKDWTAAMLWKGSEPSGLFSYDEWPDECIKRQPEFLLLCIAE